MGIEYLVCKANPKRHRIDLHASVVGLTITVSQGSFRYCGTDYALVEDQTYEVEPLESGKLWVTGYLVIVRDSGEVRVFVESSRDEAYQFQPGSSALELIEVLFHVVVPPGVDSLDDVPVQVKRLVPERS